jgi:hypothetical protein
MNVSTPGSSAEDLQRCGIEEALRLLEIAIRPVDAPAPSRPPRG